MDGEASGKSRVLNKEGEEGVDHRVNLISNALNPLLRHAFPFLSCSSSSRSPALVILALRCGVTRGP